MSENLSCLLLPLQNKNLLLPSSAVAEIIAYEEPKSIVDIPGWLLGILTWRRIQIPLAYLEKMESYSAWGKKSEEQSVEDKHKLHIAVINRAYKIEAKDEQNEKVNRYPFFSIVLKDAPRLFRISKDDVTKVTEPNTTDPRFLMEVKVKNDNAFIPDLTVLWKMIDTLPSRLQWFRQVVF